MKINKIYLDKFKRFNYGYLFMVKKGVFTTYPYKEDKEVMDVIDKLCYLGYLEL